MAVQRHLSDYGSELYRLELQLLSLGVQPDEIPTGPWKYYEMHHMVLDKQVERLNDLNRSGLSANRPNKSRCSSMGSWTDIASPEPMDVLEGGPKDRNSTKTRTLRGLYVLPAADEQHRSVSGTDWGMKPEQVPKLPPSSYSLPMETMPCKEHCPAQPEPTQKQQCWHRQQAEALQQHSEQQAQQADHMARLLKKAQHALLIQHQHQAQQTLQAQQDLLTEQTRPASLPATSAPLPADYAHLAIALGSILPSNNIDNSDNHNSSPPTLHGSGQHSRPVDQIAATARVAAALASTSLMVDSMQRQMEGLARGLGEAHGALAALSREVVRAASGGTGSAA